MKVLVVTSGKGGVGKSTTSASVSMGLANKGYKVAVLDFDVGLRNLDLMMGCERRVVYDFINVINGEATLNQALIKDKKNENLFILAASQTKDKDSLTIDGVGRVLDELKNLSFDYVVCDSPAGIEHGAFAALYYADEAIVVTNPEVSSIRDSDRIIGLLSSKSKRAKESQESIKTHLLITRYDEERVRGEEMIDAKDISEMLALKIIGIIPESKEIVTSSNIGTPVILGDGTAAKAYQETVNRYLGEEVPEEKGSESLLNKFFSYLRGSSGKWVSFQTFLIVAIKENPQPLLQNKDYK